MSWGRFHVGMFALTFGLVASCTGSSESPAVGPPQTAITTQPQIELEWAGADLETGLMLVHRPRSDPPSLAVLGVDGDPLIEYPLPSVCPECQFFRGPFGAGQTIYFHSTSGLLSLDLGDGTFTDLGELEHNTDRFLFIETGDSDQQVLDTETHQLHSLSMRVDGPFNFFEAGPGWVAVSARRTVLVNPTTGAEILLTEDERMASLTVIDGSGSLLARKVRTDGELQLSVTDLDTGTSSVWHRSQNFSAQWIGDRLVVVDSTAGAIVIVEDETESRTVPLEGLGFVSDVLPAPDGGTALIRFIDGPWFSLDLAAGQLTARPELLDLRLSLFDGPGDHVLLDNDLVEMQDDLQSYRLIATQHHESSVVEVPTGADFFTVIAVGPDSIATVHVGEGSRPNSAQLFDQATGTSVTLPAYTSGPVGFGPNGMVLALTSEAPTPRDLEAAYRTSAFAFEALAGTEPLWTTDGRFLGWLDVSS